LKAFTPQISLWAIFLFSCVSSQAQVNIQVGYGIAGLNPRINKDILSQYQSENPWLVSSQQDLSLMHGLDLGIRYSMGPASLGLAWKNRLSSWSFDGISPTTQSSFKHDLYYNLSAFSLFAELGRSFLGVGTSIDYNTFRIKERKTGFDSKIGLMEQCFWSNRFYVNLNFPAGSTAQVTLQCYYDLPWSEIQFMELADKVLSHDKPTTANGQLEHFGLSLIISNGPQD